MSDFVRWVLTDQASGLYVEEWSVRGSDLGFAEANWSIRKRRLKGGLSDGVDVIDVDNGELSYIVVPTRGMGIWRGTYHGIRLGWDSPIRGPVHPAFVNESILGNLGWLAGFDEWVVRCGLSSNGAPGTDVLVDNNGNPRPMELPLHGRIANVPAHYVEVRVDRNPPHRIEVVGIVDESMLFFPQLQLSTVIGTTPGEAKLTIEDLIVNRKSQPGELELLYHINFGPPLLEKGARWRAPIRELAPRDGVAASAIDQFADYPEPTSGVIEQVFFADLEADAGTGRTIALLHNAARDKACAMRYTKSQLPWFTVWKNPGAASDGYVTGLEPGTNLPNHRKFERTQGRVISLPPGGSYHVELELEVADGEPKVRGLLDEVARLQSTREPTVHRKPIASLSDA